MIVSPHGSGSPGYVDAVVLDDEVLYYDEYCRPDGSHELPWAASRAPDAILKPHAILAPDDTRPGSTEPGLVPARSGASAQGTLLLIAGKELPPGVLIAPARIGMPLDKGPAVIVVICFGHERRGVHEGCVEQQAL